MKIKFPVEKVKTKIILADRITSKNSSLQSLKNILLEAKNNTLFIRSTNLEVGVEFSIPVKVEKEGVCSVNGWVLSNLFSTLSNNENITFEKIENNLSISSDKNTTLLKTQSYDDFPIIPKIKEKPVLIEMNTLLDGIKSVLFSSATSDIKPEIASVFIYTENNKIVFVSTDSFRLAEKKIIFKNFNIESILIPYKNSLEIIRFFEDEKGEVKLFFNKNQLSIEKDGIYFTTRLTDGVYPDYKQILPKTFKTKAIVLKKELAESFKIANIFLDEFNRVTLRVITDDNIIEVESKNTSIGENISKIDAHTEGEYIDSSFNHRYITDVFNILNNDSVSLNFSDVNKPLVIKGVGDESFTYLVMPVSR